MWCILASHRLAIRPRLFQKVRSAPLAGKPSTRGLFGIPEGTGAAPITGAPAAHCSDSSPQPEPRGLYGLVTGSSWVQSGSRLECNTGLAESEPCLLKIACKSMKVKGEIYFRDL